MSESESKEEAHAGGAAAAGGGALYLVATPIGNLGDTSARALETFRTADAVACEDTRKTLKLLTHFGIARPLISFHEHNEDSAGRRIISMLREGRKVALATSAGTPAVSDPGFTLVRKCIAEGLPVTLVPGPAAFLMALVLSGLPVHSFTFRGFAPRKPGQRRNFIAKDASSPHTLLFYESKHRVAAFLKDAAAVLGDRRAAVATELTKMFESVERGTLLELAAAWENREAKGEYTIVIEGAESRARASREDNERPPL